MREISREEYIRVNLRWRLASEYMGTTLSTDGQTHDFIDLLHMRAYTTNIVIGELSLEILDVIYRVFYVSSEKMPIYRLPHQSLDGLAEDVMDDVHV